MIRTAYNFDPAQLGPLAACGYELVPLHSVEARDARGRLMGKAPMGSKWRLLPALSVDEAREHMFGSGSNVGVRLRPQDLVIDIDPRNFAEGDDPVRRLEKDLGICLGDYPTVVTGSGGKHIYMLKPANVLLRDTLEAYPGVEFKAHGRQVVAPGSVHPGQLGKDGGWVVEPGGEYRWDDDPLAPILAEVRPAPDALIELARHPGPIAVVDAGKRTPEELDAMLEGLDVGQYRDHSAWFELMCACHHATAGEGRDEFVAWSQGDPEFSNDASIGQRWDSLHADMDGRRVTEKTLFKALVDSGRADLLPRDSAADDFDDIAEDSENEQASARSGNPSEALIDEMNSKFCAVIESGDFVIYMNDIDELFQPPRPVLTRMSRQAFINYHENRQVMMPDQKRPISVARLWLQHPRRRNYEGIVMDPEGGPTDKLNMWRGWAITPQPGDWSLMRGLITDVLCAGNAEHGDYVIRWIAFMLQKPWVRPEVAIAFRGAEGTGKSTLGRALMRIAGDHGITVASARQLAGNFNAHLQSAVFVFADEALWQGDKGAEGVLKQLVTEPVIAIEAKGKDVRSARNMVHLMLASNEEYIVPAGKGARRFAVFDVSDERKCDREYFGRLNRQLEDGGLQAMLHDLLSIDLGEWHPASNVPVTEALGDQKALSLKPGEAFWRQILERGSLPTAEGEGWDDGTVTIVTGRDLLVEQYASFLRQGPYLGARATSKALVEAGKLFGLMADKSAGNQRCWRIPRLDDARARFEAAVGSAGLFD